MLLIGFSRGGSPLAFLEKPSEATELVAVGGGSSNVAEGMKLGTISYAESRSNSLLDGLKSIFVDAGSGPAVFLPPRFWAN